MKTLHEKATKKQAAKTWLIRICALLLVALLLVGSCYYTIWALLA